MDGRGKGGTVSGTQSGNQVGHSAKLPIGYIGKVYMKEEKLRGDSPVRAGSSREHIQTALIANMANKGL